MLEEEEEEEGSSEKGFTMKSSFKASFGSYATERFLELYLPLRLLGEGEEKSSILDGVSLLSRSSLVRCVFGEDKSAVVTADRCISSLEGELLEVK